jgi:hypothetical protein
MLPATTSSMEFNKNIKVNQLPEAYKYYIKSSGECVEHRIIEV